MVSPPPAKRVLLCRMLEWADLIFIMADQQLRSLRRGFAGDRAIEHLIRLDIPDEFTSMQPGLVELLNGRATPPPARSAATKTRHAACQMTADPSCRDT